MASVIINEIYLWSNQFTVNYRFILEANFQQILIDFQIFPTSFWNEEQNSKTKCFSHKSPIFSNLNQKEMMLFDKHISSENDMYNKINSKIMIKPDNANNYKL